MWLIAGLGNPGSDYEHTRHNIGFDAVDALASAWHAGPFKSGKSGHGALTSRVVWAKNDVLLAKPQTFMNLSGEPVGALLRYYKIDLGHCIVVHDELDFTPGRVQVKVGGGHGGHNGLRSILQHVGLEHTETGDDFVRVRVGIGKAASKEQMVSYVLSRFNASEHAVMQEALARVVEAVSCVIEQSVDEAMRRVN